MAKTFPEPQGFESDPRPSIPMEDVDSTQIKQRGFDAATQTLALTFTRGPGHLYCYPFTTEQWAAFKVAESAGKYFGSVIKPLPFKKYHAEGIGASA